MTGHVHFLNVRLGTVNTFPPHLWFNIHFSHTIYVWSLMHSPLPKNEVGQRYAAQNLFFHIRKYGLSERAKKGPCTPLKNCRKNLKTLTSVFIPKATIMDLGSNYLQKRVYLSHPNIDVFGNAYILKTRHICTLQSPPIEQTCKGYVADGHVKFGNGG